MKLTPRPDTLPGGARSWGCSEPLWRRVPKRDEVGRPYVDFMMLAPRLNKRPSHEQESIVLLVRGVLVHYDEWVVFADLNLKINVLWVSMKQRPGLMSELVAAIRVKVPEFHLIGHNPLANS
jgi:hypothetical protein